MADAQMKEELTPPPPPPPPPPIRVIDFESFRKLRSFPRYPENKSICVDISSVDRENSLILFISHCWLRGYAQAPGYDGRPHPDNKNHDKFKLTVVGVYQAWKALAPGMKKCYVWLDFGCMNQDEDPAGELKQLDTIVSMSDALFTCLHDPEPDWILSPTYENLYEEYKAANWIGAQYGYINRGWCRVEMFFAANLPLGAKLEDISRKNALHLRHTATEDEMQPHKVRAQKFAAGLKFHAMNGRRPHLLFGTRERNTSRPVMILPPLSNTHFEQLDPRKGNVSVDSDRVKINELVEIILPRMKLNQDASHSKYTGLRDEIGRKHGLGIEMFPNGDKYEGWYVEDLKDGKGVMTYSNGAIYDGDWMKDHREGLATYTTSTGDKYKGEFADNDINGSGHLTLYNGLEIAGEFKDAFICNGTIKTFDGTILYNGAFDEQGVPSEVNCYWVSRVLCCIVPGSCCCAIKVSNYGMIDACELISQSMSMWISD